MTASATTVSRRALFSAASAVWLTFGLVQCAQSYVRALATGAAWHLSTAITGGMPWWLSWWMLTPVLAALATRYPIPATHRARPFAALVVSGIAVSCVQLTATGTVYWFTTGRTAGPATSLPNQLQRFFGNYFLESICTTAAVIGVFVAIDFARAARDERLIRARLEADAAALEASVTKAQLAALAMELNPHFLFNTMSAISGLIAQGKSDDAREVIRRLSELLRRTLEAGFDQTSTVADEIEWLEDYLFIQRMRFSDRLSVALDVDTGAGTCAMPPMLLQPLVENAVRHGVELNEGRGEVSIRIARDNGSLRISIADSGAGFALGENGLPAREGVGIANTRARLERLYRAKASLRLQNRPEGGGEAVVTIPAEDT